MSNIYLDNASTTPMRPEVIEIIKESFHKFFGNPSSSHHLGRLSRSMIEISRKKISNLLNVHSSEIIFTSGGTESNNMILTTAIQNLNIKRILTSPIEHKSILEISFFLSKIQGIKLEFIKLKSNGVIDLEDLENKLKNSSLTTLVSLMHANNEIGNISSLYEIGLICKKNKAWFHSDAIQTIGHYPLDLQKIKIDFISCSAHKFYGPKGIGFVFIRNNSIEKGFILGGLQERGIRAGTENIYGILGMTKALECSLQKLKKERHYIESLKFYAISKLRKSISCISFNGLSDNLDQSLYMILNISIPIKDNLLSFYFDLKGIFISQGSACLSGSSKSSYVIKEIYDKNYIKNKTSLRISFGYFNTKKDIDNFVFILKQYLKENIKKL